ncbi:MAG: twin-arginine translocation signal domain-containing protein, partial [Rhodospirillaceae bacterium]|nr:twin-arginine translocation signal domain-containing protein [Rhodospirillaceae bacterium]
MIEKRPGFNRRKFLSATAATGAVAALPAIPGCSSA